MNVRRILTCMGALAAAVVLTAGCQSGLGSFPGHLVDLYDDGAPDGLIELELERDGTITEMEADIPVSALPEAVVAAAKERMPGAEFTGAEREVQTGGSVWEVKLLFEGRAWELVICSAGVVRETEQELEPGDAPPAVLEAAEAAIPGSSFVSVEVIKEMTGHVEYHVKRTRDGASYKVVLSPEGVVTRKVREHRAEIEIPLR